jgi:hypothetical protein
MQSLARPKKSSEPAPPKNTRAPVSQATWLARMVRWDAPDRVWVELEENGESILARTLRGMRRNDLVDEDGAPRALLVVFARGKKTQAVITGVLASETGQTSTGVPEQLVIEAGTELVLKCGAGTISVRKDGKVIVRGTHLLSRSSGPIRIKGGHVEIN